MGLPALRRVRDMRNSPTFSLYKLRKSERGIPGFGHGYRRWTYIFK